MPWRGEEEVILTLHQCRKQSKQHKVVPTAAAGLLWLPGLGEIVWIRSVEQMQNKWSGCSLRLIWGLWGKITSVTLTFFVTSPHSYFPSLVYCRWVDQGSKCSVATTHWSCHWVTLFWCKLMMWTPSQIFERFASWSESSLALCVRVCVCVFWFYDVQAKICFFLSELTYIWVLF